MDLLFSHDKNQANNTTTNTSNGEKTDSSVSNREIQDNNNSGLFGNNDAKDRMAALERHCFTLQTQVRTSVLYHKS